MANDFKHLSKVSLSVRRKEIKGLPGDDVTLHNLKIGSSLSGKGPLRGLSFLEEVKYLPEIINISPTDNEWRSATKDYWSNISSVVPADGIGTSELHGLPLIFTISFPDAITKEAFEHAESFERKAEIAEKGTVVEGVEDYVLWRYCLVYSKVANKFTDVGKSPKILFYLYSKETETLVAHSLFKTKRKAQDLFASMLDKEPMVDAVLLMFAQDISAFTTLADKHLALDALVQSKPKEFIMYVEDGNLAIKSFLKKAVEKRIIHKPANTDSYYYGENREICLGNCLDDAVLYCKSTEPQNVEIINIIKAKIKNT